MCKEKFFIWQLVDTIPTKGSYQKFYELWYYCIILNQNKNHKNVKVWKLFSIYICLGINGVLF